MLSHLYLPVPGEKFLSHAPDGFSIFVSNEIFNVTWIQADLSSVQVEEQAEETETADNIIIFEWVWLQVTVSLSSLPAVAAAFF